MFFRETQAFVARLVELAQPQGQLAIIGMPRSRDVVLVCFEVVKTDL